MSNFKNKKIHNYGLEVIYDIVLGVVLGILVNIITDKLSSIFHLRGLAKIILQLMLIIIVLYLLKYWSNYLYSSWQGEAGYGVVFVSIFLVVQKNLTRFFENVYVEETGKFFQFNSE